jgi:two-component system, cell cycle response regulator DivK
MFESDVAEVLPAVRHGARPRARPRRRPAARPLVRPRSRPLVLLVDDLEDQRELYRQYLEFAGYEVAVARDGFEGIDRALSANPDVVVMDLAMPGLDGFEATQRLRLLDRTRGIPVIALTAHSTLPREWAVSAGCDGYLAKPCYPDDLRAAIADLLARPRRERVAPPPPAPRRPHVLVIDASVADRELLAEYLEYRGCTVTVSVDLDAAVRDAQRARPAVIVLDVDAPLANGWGVLAALRQHASTRDIPVIALSRKALASGRAQSLGAELLIKPCEPETLFVQIGRMARGGPVDPA